MSIDGDVVQPLSRVWISGVNNEGMGRTVIASWNERATPERVSASEGEVGFPLPYLADQRDRLWVLPRRAEGYGSWGLYERLGAADLLPVDAGGASCPSFDACTFEIRARRAPMAYDGYREEYWDARPEEWVHATMSLPSWDELQAWSGGGDEIVTDSRYDGVVYASTRYLYVGFDGDDVTIEMRATNGAEPIRARIHDR